MHRASVEFDGKIRCNELDSSSVVSRNTEPRESSFQHQGRAVQPLSLRSPRRQRWNSRRKELWESPTLEPGQERVTRLVSTSWLSCALSVASHDRVWGRPSLGCNTRRRPFRETTPHNIVRRDTPSLGSHRGHSASRSHTRHRVCPALRRLGPLPSPCPPPVAGDTTRFALEMDPCIAFYPCAGSAISWPLPCGKPILLPVPPQELLQRAPRPDYELSPAISVRLTPPRLLPSRQARERERDCLPPRPSLNHTFEPDVGGCASARSSGRRNQRLGVAPTRVSN